MVMLLAISRIIPGAHLASSELDTSCLVFRKALGGPRSSGTMNSMFSASEVGFTAIPP